MVVIRFPRRSREFGFAEILNCSLEAVIKPLFHSREEREHDCDAAFLMEGGPNSIETYRVRSQGPGINDLVWEYNSPMGGWYICQLIDFSADFSTFIVGATRSNNEPSLNPNKIFQYSMYQAQ